MPHHRDVDLKDLPEHLQRIHQEELLPAIEALEAVLKRHNMAAVLVVQAESMHERTTDAGEEGLGAVHHTALLNFNPLKAFVEKLNEIMRDEAKSYDEFVDFMQNAEQEGLFVVSPVMMAMTVLAQNGIDPLSVLMLASQSGHQADLSDEQRQVIANAMQEIKNIGLQQRAQRDVPTFVPHSENGRFVGFKDTRTGEVEYLEGFGPQSEQN